MGHRDSRGWESTHENGAIPWIWPSWAVKGRQPISQHCCVKHRRTHLSHFTGCRSYYPLWKVEYFTGSIWTIPNAGPAALSGPSWAEALREKVSCMLSTATDCCLFFFFPTNKQVNPLWSSWDRGQECWRMPTAMSNPNTKHRDLLDLTHKALFLRCVLQPILCWEWEAFGASRKVLIEVLYQAHACLSWRAWKSYGSAKYVSGWGGEHENNHHCCGRQYIMVGLPGWRVNAICLCVCFSEG